MVSIRSAKRPVLYQLCRAGERFEVGDGPVLLSRQRVVIGRGDPAQTDAGHVFVDDPWMSTAHAHISPLERGVPRQPTGSSARVREGTGGTMRFVVEDAGSTNGILVNGAPTQRAPLLHGDLLETGRTFWLYVEEPVADPPLTEPFEIGAVSTWTPSFARDLSDLVPVVPTAEHVLVVGAAGTGKGFLARTIHVVSGRTGRLLHLDCRERRPKRLLVDLFGDGGHAGRLREAEGGTVLLENIDTLPLDVQDRLADALRRRVLVLDGRTRSGAREMPLSSRVIATMAASVEEAVAAGRLRATLVDAVGAVQVRMPTLNQRWPDLGLLLDEFLARARGAPAISRDACRCVLKFPFRQHARAMGRVIEGAATLAGEPDLEVAGGQRGVIEVGHLPVDVVGPELLRHLLGVHGAGLPDNTSESAAVTTGAEPSIRTGDDNDATEASLQNPLLQPRASTPAHGVAAARARGDRSERRSNDTGGHVDVDAVAAALKAAHGNVSAAARALGRSRALVLRWIREFGLDRRGTTGFK
jgi:DNA-binding NtrC family response regulator